MRTLVTGAGGFIGANLVRRLLRDGHEVHGVGRPGLDRWRLTELGSDVAHHETDLRDEDALDALLSDVKPDWVFHLAAHGAYSWQRDVRAILETNLIVTASLVESALMHGAQAVVHAGSSSEYGFQDHAPAETELPVPNSAYAVGKVAATLYCAHVGRRDGGRVVTLRLYSVYGPWEEPGRLVPTLITRGLRGELPPLVAPETARDFVYVDDVCDAFVRAAQDGKPGAIFNIGSGRQTTLREVVETVRELLDVTAQPDWGSHDQRVWDTSVWVAAPARAASELGWSATTELELGLRQTVQWLRERGELAGRYEQVATR